MYTCCLLLYILLCQTCFNWRVRDCDYFNLFILYGCDRCGISISTFYCMDREKIFEKLLYALFNTIVGRLVGTYIGFSCSQQKAHEAIWNGACRKYRYWRKWCTLLPSDASQPTTLRRLTTTHWNTAQFPASYNFISIHRPINLLLGNLNEKLVRVKNERTSFGIACNNNNNNMLV